MPAPVRRDLLDMPEGTQGTPKGNRVPEGWRKVFLKSLARTGSVKASAKFAGVGRRFAYKHKAGDAKFSAAWDNAIESAIDLMEAEARRRAMKGMLKPGFYKGEKCGSVREYSDRLLMFLLKAYRPERFRDNFNLRRFLDDLAAHQSLAGQSPFIPWPGWTRSNAP
jgi:hypothetical protein